MLVAAAGAERDDAAGAAANGQLEREPASKRVADEMDGAFEALIVDARGDRVDERVSAQLSGPASASAPAWPGSVGAKTS